jgi:hypothetical protein
MKRAECLGFDVGLPERIGGGVGGRLGAHVGGTVVVESEKESDLEQDQLQPPNSNMTDTHTTHE